MKTIQSKLMVIFGIFLALAIAGIVIISLNTQKDDGKVINLAGKQRMLTQKMSKESLAVSQGVVSKDSLEKTIKLFDKTINGLISGDVDLDIPPAKNTGIIAQLNHVQKLWKDLNTNLDVVIANSGETSAALSYINDNNIKLLKEMNKAVSMLEKKGSDPVKINLSGKQRMLSQKMSKEVIALSQGKGTKETLEETINLFDKTLNGIISGNSELGLSTTKDPEIISQLNNVQELWKEFRANLDIVIAGSTELNTALSYLNKNNIGLLKEMNKAVVMLEEKLFDAKTINLAGKQRMLTQKIVKESLGLVRGIEKADFVKSTSVLFDKTLKGLISGDEELGLSAMTDAAVLAQLQNVQKLWDSFYGNINTVLKLAPEANDALVYIRENNIGLLKASHKVVALLEGKAIASNTINLAGKQRMLTQKMVKETLSLVQGKGSSDNLRNTSTLFDKTLKGLISGDEELGLPATTDAAIVAQLENIQRLWDSFYGNVNTVLKLAPETNGALVYITGNNVELLKEMNKAVGLFEAESGRKAAFLSWSNTIVVVVTIITVLVAWFFIVMPLVRTLTRLVNNLSGSSSQVASAAEQISASSQSLAQGSSEQASSIEETSASMEEMSSVTRQNANNAQEAAKLVDMCSLAAENGNKAVVEMSSSMEEINTSNKKIAEITKVIDGIAFQTNLLALNAAVEAARAGEHGKGFAVVAEEVRNLAQRSAAAAKDTTNLVDDCVSRAENGAKVAAKCSESLDDIVKNVKKASDLTKEITNASSEQSEGIGQVNGAVQQMDQVTQQNAASAEETASASEELTAQSQNMMEQVEVLSAQVNRKTNGVSKSNHNGIGHVTHKEISRNEIHAQTSAHSGNSAKSGTAKGNGNGKDHVQHKTNPDDIIPMGENRVAEHEESFKDF